MTTDRAYPPVIMPLRATTVVMTKVLFNSLADIATYGLQNVPADGPILMVTNHMSYLEPPVIATTIPRMCYTLMADKYRYHLLSIYMRIAGAIFVKRGQVDRQALRQSLAVLADEHMLIVAIEGTRSRDGGLQKGKTGVAYMATKANVPILPVVVWGTVDAVEQWKKFQRPEFFVSYGKPFNLPEGRANKEQLEIYTEQIMLALANLLPDKHRGYYRDHPDVKPFEHPADDH